MPLANLQIKYPIEGAKQFATSLEEVNKRIEELKRSAQGLEKELTGIFKDATQGVQEIAKSTAVGITGNLEKQLANLDAKLAQVAARAKQLGVRVPGLQEHHQMVKSLRDAGVTAKELTNEQEKAVRAAQNFADIHEQNIRTIRAETDLQRQKKELDEMAASTAERTLQARAQATREEQVALKQTEVTLERLSTQLSTMETRLRGRGKMDTVYGEALIGHKREIEAILEKIRLNQQLTATEQERVKNIIHNARISIEQAKQVEVEAKRMARSSETFWERRVGWFIAGTAFYGSLKAFRDTLKTIGDVEMGMIEIDRVIGDTTASIDEMRDSLLKTAKDFGTSFEQTQQIALRWAQAGYSVVDTLELTKTSLLALNTAELNVEQATSGLIAIMAQWNIEASELLPTFDKISKAADNYSITATDLVAGLGRASGAAKVLGMSLEETVAVLTVMREATGRTGKEVGNALNSILSFIQRTKTIELFEAEGIQVWADEARSSFRNVIEIFDDMAARWPQMTQATQDMFVDSAQAAGLYTEELADVIGATEEFTDAQQRDLAQATAGIYRRNYLLALLQNWGRVQDVLTVQEDALGYSLSKNEQAMETYQKQVEQLRVEITRLQVALGDSGLLGIMVKLVQTGTYAFELLNRLSPPVKTMIVHVGAITSALLALQTVMRTLSLDVTLLKSGAAIKDAAREVRTLKQVLTGAQAALAAFVSANAPMLIAITTIAGALTVYNEISRTNEEMLRQSKMASALVDEYDKLTARLGELEKGTESYRQSNAQLHKLQKEILREFPQLWEESGNVNIEKLREMSQAHRRLEEEAKAARTAMEQLREEFNKTAKTITDQINKHERHKELLRDLVNRYVEIKDTIEAQNQTEVELAQSKKDLISIEDALINIIGREGFARLKAAGFAKEAIEIEIRAINKLIEEQRELEQLAIEGQQRQTRAHINETRKRINNMEKELQAIRIMARAYEGFPLQKGRLVGAGVERHTSVLWGKAGEIQAAIEEEEESLRKAIEHFDTLNEEMANLLTSTSKAAGGVSELGGGMESLSGGMERLSDIIRKFIDSVAEASEAIGIQNEELQRAIELVEARIDFFGREKARYDQQLRANREQVAVLALLREKQKGIHEEAEKTREAIAKLEARQRTLNLSSEEGKKAFSDLRNEIKNLKGEVNELSIEWWKLQEIIDDTGLSTKELERQARERHIDITQTKYDHYRGLGAPEGWMQAEILRQQLLTKLAEKTTDLQRRSSELGIEIDKLRRENETLNPTIQEQSDKIRVNNALINEWEKQQAELTTQIYQTKNVVNELNSETHLLSGHATAMVNQIQSSVRSGLISLEQSLQLLDTLEQQASSFDSLVSLRGEILAKKWTTMLEDELARAKKIYEQNIKDLDDQIKRVNNRAEAQIESINKRIETTRDALKEELELLQEMLDALDEEEKHDEREKATEEHNRTIKELNDNRIWYVLRGEEKYAFEIAAIDKAILDERKRWGEQLRKWELEDERARIKDLMDAAKERAQVREDDLRDEIDHVKERQKNQIESLQEEKERLKQHWDDKEEGVRAIMRKGLVNTLAEMAAKDPDFLERGQSLMQNLIAGISSQKASLQAEVNAINRIIDQIQRAESRRIEQEIRSGPSHDPYASSEALLRAKEEYDRAKARGDEAGMRAAHDKANAIRESSPTLDPDNTKTADELREEIKKKRGYALGAYLRGRVQEVRGATLHEYGEAGDEVILPLSRAVPVLSESLMIAIKKLQIPQPETHGLEIALIKGLRELGGKIPKQITVVAQIDSEAVATKTIPLLGKQTRQSMRRW